MSIIAQQIENFRDFAEKELKNHLLQLNALYTHGEPSLYEIKQQAYAQHQKTFQLELLSKMKELLTDENQFLKPTLSRLVDRFMSKFKQAMDVDKTQ